MAFTIADKFDFDVVEQAKALKIPPVALKIIIQKLFNMGSWNNQIPDQISFIEQAKAFPKEAVNGVILDTYRPQRLLLNGVDTMTVGLYEGEGTDVDSVITYICKAYHSVYDLTPWYGVMDDRLKRNPPVAS